MGSSNHENDLKDVTFLNQKLRVQRLPNSNLVANGVLVLCFSNSVCDNYKFSHH